MTAPHETPIPGPAQAHGARKAAMIPVIDTPRLRLRAPRMEDFDAWADILTGPAAPHLGGPFTRDDAFTEFAASVGTWRLRGHALRSVDTCAGELVGLVLIGFELGDLEPELGYLFRPAAEGRGYATEAATAARDHALCAMGLPSLVSFVAPDNARSGRVAARLGAHCDAPHDGSDVWRHAPHRSAC